MSVPITVLSDIDRQNLLREKEARAKELEAKRLELERVKEALRQAIEKPVAVHGVDAQSILKSALIAAEETAREAAEKYTPSPIASQAESPQVDRLHDAGPRETVQFPQVEIPLQDQIIRYEKGCQTEETEELDYLKEPRPSQDTLSPQVPRLSQATNAIRDDELDRPPSPLSISTSHPQTVQPSDVLDTAAIPEQSKMIIEVKDIPLEEKIRIQQSAGFHNFVKKSVFALEKILNVDKIVDVMGDFGDNQAQRPTQAGLRNIVAFDDHRLGSKRAVTDIQPCTHPASSFIASYGKRKDAFSSEVDGCCLVWSLENPARPLHTLTSHAPVTCVTQGSDSSNLIFGGTSTGSIVMWDVRAQQTPIQTTRITFETHQTQVQTIVKQGSNTPSSTILSIDEESRACFWSLAMNLTLSSTLDFRQFGAASDASPTAANKKGMLFAAAIKGTTLYGGCEDGSILEASLSTASGKVDSKIHEWHGKNDTATWVGSPVLGIDPKPIISNGPALGLDLMLTCSTNWTLTIWNKVLGGSFAPIHILEPAEDYTFDVRWSPCNPTVFGCVGGDGVAHIYNLNKSWHSPILSHSFIENVALSKMAWFMEGKGLLCGSSEGTIYAAVVPTEVYTYKNNSLNLFEDTLASMNRTVVGEGI